MSVGFVYIVRGVGDRDESNEKETLKVEEYYYDNRKNSQKVQINYNHGRRGYEGNRSEITQYNGESLNECEGSGT